MSQMLSAKALINDYSSRLQEVLALSDWTSVNLLAQDMLECWRSGRQLFICGNGGSAANAVHLANDLGYDYIFSEQLAVQAQAGDLLITLSGSGNSANIVRALEQAKVMGLKSYAILGFTGGRCRELADVPIHFPINDMQIAEDLQLIVGHMMMQWLYANRSK